MQVQETFITLPSPSDLAKPRRIAYRSWGDATNTNIVVCVHGLSRNSRDFDRLSSKLSTKYRVICPDMAGRGDSDWLENKNDYNYFTYISDVLALLMYLHIPAVDWVGTSMGGIIGMMMAAQYPNVIKRMVLNDVGAKVSAAGLKRILGYVGSQSHFSTRAEAMSALKYYLAPFGIQSDADWDYMCDISFQVQPDGGYSFAYDPDITKPFRELAMASGVIADIDLTAYWLRVICPTLILRGAQSDILSSETAHAMLLRPSQTKLIEFQNVGHAPALIDEKQITPIIDWLA